MLFGLNKKVLWVEVRGLGVFDTNAFLRFWWWEFSEIKIWAHFFEVHGHLLIRLLLTDIDATFLNHF